MTMVGELYTQNFLFPNTLDLTLLLLLGFWLFRAILYDQGLSAREASKVAPFKYVEVIFTLFEHTCLMKLHPSKFIGDAMVISGLTASTLYKERKSRTLKADLNYLAGDCSFPFLQFLQKSLSF